jgi:hypothetical protein
VVCVVGAEHSYPYALPGLSPAGARCAMLLVPSRALRLCRARAAGTHFTCFTGTKYCVLYWYKSTDSEGERCAYAVHEQQVLLSLLNYLRY